MITMVEHMSPFTYMRLRIKEIWHSYFDRMVEAAWNRTTARKESEQRDSMNVKKNYDNSYFTVNSLPSGVIGSNLTQTYNGNYSNISGIGGIGPIGLAPLTTSSLNTISLNPQGVLNLNNDYGQSQPIQFTVHNANGGKVVEYIVSDGSTRKTKLHVITPEQDLGSELGKIITLELLRN